ncbi:MAG: flagellar hook-basal body complex protein FliE [Spirochaetes bacterium]|nr:flagellar hook-basal body complex protein FliE [Spirochaetota bacterium]
MMKILSNFNGDIVNLKVSHKKHILDNPQNQVKGDSITKSFSNLFNNMIGEVNNLELKATDLTNQMVINPDSVNIHDVQIAAEQAEMAILLTKGIMDRVIRAYREVSNLR